MSSSITEYSPVVRGCCDISALIGCDEKRADVKGAKVDGPSPIWSEGGLQAFSPKAKQSPTACLVEPVENVLKNIEYLLALCNRVYTCMDDMHCGKP